MSLKTSRKTVAGGAVVAAVMVCAWLPNLAAQTTKKTVTQKAEQGPRRVPQYFGKVGMTNEQKEKVYAVQAKHYQKIQELQNELDKARGQMMSECESVLTPEQRKVLAQLRHANNTENPAKTEPAEDEPAAKHGETKKETGDFSKKKAAAAAKKK